MSKRFALAVLVLAAALPARAQVGAALETKIILRSSFGFALQNVSYQAAFEADEAIRAALDHDAMGAGTGISLAASSLRTLRQQAPQVKLNTSGKLLLCLNMREPWGRRPPSIDCVENPQARGEWLALLEVPAGGLSLRRDREPDRLKMTIAHGLRKACSDLRTLVGEVAAVASYKFRELDERAFESRVRSGAIYQASDAATALRNGLALARDMYWLADSVADISSQGLFQGHNHYRLYRRALPRSRQALCWLIFLSQREPGARQLSARGWGTFRGAADADMDPDEWYDPVFERPGAGLARTPPRLRSMQEQESCEAQVALVLSRLFAGDTYSSKPVREKMKAGATSLSAVLRELEKDEADKKKKPFVRWSAGRRTLGAYVDEGAARALVAQRIANKTSMHQYNTALTRLITRAEPSPRVVAADLKQTLGAGRFAEPSERIRALIDFYGHPKAHQLREQYRTSHQMGHYLAQLTDAEHRNADALASLQETNEHLAHPGWWEEFTLHTFLNEFKEIKAVVTTLRPPPHHDVTFHGGLAAATLKFGAFSLLVHHVTHQDYSFLKCDMPFGKKVKQLAIALGRFHFTPGVVAKIAISTAIYGVVLGVGSRVIPALAAAALFEYYAYPALAKWNERQMLSAAQTEYREGIPYWIGVYADPACTRAALRHNMMVPRAHIGSFGPGVPDDSGAAQRREILRSVMGGMKVEEVETFDCVEGARKTRREVLDGGWFGHWVDVHNKELGHRLAEVREFVSETLEPVQELESLIAHAQNPFKGYTRDAREFEGTGGLLTGEMWMGAVRRFSVDEEGNVRRPEEIADRIVQVLVSSPALEKKRGTLRIDDGASLDAAHAHWVSRVREHLKGESVEEIQEKHRENVARLGEELSELREKQVRVNRAALQELREEGLPKIRAVHDFVARELADLDRFRLDRVFAVHDRTGEPLPATTRGAVQSMIDRRDHLARAVPALKKLIDGWTRDGAFDPDRRAPAPRHAE